MRRDFLITALTLPLAGCSTIAKYFTEERTQVCLSPDDARQHWAVIREVYFRVRPRVVAACAGTDDKIHLAPEVCAELAGLDAQFRQIAFEISTWIDNPGVKPNWAHIAQALEVVAKIIMAVI